MSVTLYTQPLCRSCDRVKRKLTAAGIEFREVDILKDDKAYSFVKYTLGAKSVPVVEATGYNPIVGYEPQLLNYLIETYPR